MASFSGFPPHAHRTPDQASYRVDLILRTEHSLGIGECRTEDQQRFAHFFWLAWSQVRHFEPARTLLADLNGVLQRVDLLNVFRIGRVDQRANCCQRRSAYRPLLW